MRDYRVGDCSTLSNVSSSYSAACGFFLKLIFSLAKNRHTLAWPTMIRRWASRPRISR